MYIHVPLISVHIVPAVYIIYMYMYTVVAALFLLQVHDLGFEFPFYGHTLDSVAVTTGGTFTYMYMYMYTYMYIQCMCRLITRVFHFDID